MGIALGAAEEVPDLLCVDVPGVAGLHRAPQTRRDHAKPSECQQPGASGRRHRGGGLRARLRH